MKKLLSVIFVLVACAGCNVKNSPMKVNVDAKQKLNDFKIKDKLILETTGLQYQGLSKPEYQTQLNILLNKAADDFISTTENGPTEKKFQNNIAVGLERFSPYYLNLDTEDKEKICFYFEELMDCVGLESSDGLLNKWMYGFDPTAKP